MRNGTGWTFQGEETTETTTWRCARCKQRFSERHVQVEVKARLSEKQRALIRAYLGGKVSFCLLPLCLPCWQVLGHVHTI